MEVVTSTNDIPKGQAQQVTVGDVEVCVVNLGTAGVRAIGNICSHAEAYLHEGDVDIDDETIECPRHGSVFDLNTGRPKSLPATLPVEAFRVKTEGEDILIEVR